MNRIETGQPLPIAITRTNPVCFRVKEILPAPGLLEEMAIRGRIPDSCRNLSNCKIGVGILQRAGAGDGIVGWNVAVLQILLEMRPLRSLVIAGAEGHVAIRLGPSFDHVMKGLPGIEVVRTEGISRR